jgi:hypothetical protein
MLGRLTDLIAGDVDTVMPGEKCQLGAGCVYCDITKGKPLENRQYKANPQSN